MTESISASSSKSPAPSPRRVVPAKRKQASQNHVHQACSVCKARKARCDSIRPRCSFCEGRDLECVYPPLYKRALCSQSHVDNLEAQVHELQAQLQLQAQANATCQQSPIPSPPAVDSHIRSDGKQQSPLNKELFSRPDSGQVDHQVPALEHLADNNIIMLDDTQPSYLQNHLQLDEDRNTMAPVQREAAASADESSGMEMADHLPATDGMVEYAQSSPDGDDSDGRYGDSYSLKFAMRVKASTMPTRFSFSRAIQREKGGEIPQNMPVQLQTPQEARQSKDAEDDIAALRSYLTAPPLQDLPRRHLAKQLLECYFADVHHVWPFLIEEDTRAELEKTYTSEDPVKPISIAKLNMMFALGCQFSPTLVEAGDLVNGTCQVGTVFYRSARAFIVANAFNMCSIGMLQALLLMAQYQQGTMRGKQFWLTISHATRIAQCLGLHLESYGASLPPLDRELGRRLWWGCFSLDRVASMIYGRHPIISLPTYSTPSLPQCIDDTYIRNGGEHPEGVASINAFFLSTVHLYLVMDNIMEILQAMNRPSGKGRAAVEKCTPLEILMGVLKSDEQLLSWHSSLPEYLRFPLDYTEQYESQHPRWVERCKTILKNRFLGLRILLHRQTILFLLQRSPAADDATGPLYHWPPLFSGFFNGQATWDASRRPESHLERPLAYLSAQICIQSAQQQIDTISICRPQQLTGAWWWDFHFNFDSLCVLLGAVGLPPDHRAAVILDVAAVHGTITNGLKTIHSLLAFGGERVRQSEQFLRQLHRVAYIENEQNNLGRFQNDMSKVTELIHSGSGGTSSSVMGPDAMEKGPAIDNWGPPNNMLPGSVMQDVTENIGDSAYFSTDKMGDLLHSSFSWNAFDYLSETSQDLEYGSDMMYRY